MSPPVLEALIPIVMFIALAAVVVFFIVYRHRGKQELQNTLRTAIDKGQELTPELIKQMGAPAEAPKDRDLRRALIAIAVGAAFLAMGFAIPEEEAMQVFGGIASFPIFIGLAYLAMHFLGSKDNQ